MDMAETVRRKMTRNYTDAHRQGAREDAQERGIEYPPLRLLLREGITPALFACLCAMWSIPGGIAPAGVAAVAAVLTVAPTLFASASQAALFAMAGGLAGSLIAGAMPQAVACALLYVAWEVLRRLGLKAEIRSVTVLSSGIALLCMLLFGPHTMLDTIYGFMTAATTAVLALVFVTALSVRPRARTLLSGEELICLSLAAMAMVCGTQGITILDFSPALLGACAIAIACGSVGGAAVGAAAGVLVGGCISLGGYDMRGVAVTLGVAGLLSGAFRKLGRIGSCAAFALGALIASAAGGMLLSPRMYMHVLPACALLLCIPKGAYLQLLARADRVRNAAMIRSAVDSGQCERAAERLGACATLFTSLSEALSGGDAQVESAARQMEAMAETLSGLEVELSRGERLDLENTQILREALDRSGFAAASADIVHTEEGREARVTFTACNGRGNCVREIGSTIASCTGNRVRARTSCAPSEGSCALIFEEVPPYDAITGIACKPASAPCGDSHLLRALPGGRFMMAIADGMGSGAAAATESDEALTLLERCLNAKLDPVTALPMINDILLLKGGEEMYTTLDLCVIDLHGGFADFYKIGSPNSYVRRKSDVMTILSGALPMGILGGVTPAHHRVALKEGDVIVMVSDGISDASREEAWMRDQLRRIDTRNPQVTADLLEAAAHFEAGDAADDRPVLCARIFWRG